MAKKIDEIMEFAVSIFDLKDKSHQVNMLRDLLRIAYDTGRNEVLNNYYVTNKYANNEEGK